MDPKTSQCTIPHRSAPQHTLLYHTLLPTYCTLLPNFTYRTVPYPILPYPTLPKSIESIPQWNLSYLNWSYRINTSCPILLCTTHSLSYRHPTIHVHVLSLSYRISTLPYVELISILFRKGLCQQILKLSEHVIVFFFHHVWRDALLHVVKAYLFI